MVAGELAHLAGEMHAAIGEQDLGLADAAGIEDDLARRRIAGVVLVGDAEIEIAERHPDALAAPAHVDRLALERHRLAEGGDRLRRAAAPPKRASKVNSPARTISLLIDLSWGCFGTSDTPTIADRPVPDARPIPAGSCPFCRPGARPSTQI